MKSDILEKHSAGVYIESIDFLQRNTAILPLYHIESEFAVED